MDRNVKRCSSPERDVIAVTQAQDALRIPGDLLTRKANLNVREGEDDGFSHSVDRVVPKGARKKNLNKTTLSLTADRLDTGANWRVLVLSPAHHRSRLSDSVKNGNALSSVHNAAVPAR